MSVVTEAKPEESKKGRANTKQGRLHNTPIGHACTCMYQKSWLNCKSVLLSLTGTKRPRGKADGSAQKPPKKKKATEGM